MSRFLSDIKMPQVMREHAIGMLNAGMSVRAVAGMWSIRCCPKLLETVSQAADGGEICIALWHLWHFVACIYIYIYIYMIIALRLKSTHNPVYV